MGLQNIYSVLNKFYILKWNNCKCVFWAIIKHFKIQTYEFNLLKNINSGEQFVQVEKKLKDISKPSKNDKYKIIKIVLGRYFFPHSASNSKSSSLCSPSSPSSQMIFELWLSKKMPTLDSTSQISCWWPSSRSRFCSARSASTIIIFLFFSSWISSRRCPSYLTFLYSQI